MPLNFLFLSFHQDLDYIKWLEELDQFHTTPRYIKYRDLSYQEYLENLLSYLKGFVKRALPLVDLKKVETQFEEEFEARFDAGKVPGWQEKTHKMGLFARPTNRLFANEGAYKGHISGKVWSALDLTKSQRRKCGLCRKSFRILILNIFYRHYLFCLFMLKSVSF